MATRLGGDAIPVGHAILDMLSGGRRAERARRGLVGRLNEFGMGVTYDTVPGVVPGIVASLDERLPGWREPAAAREANADGRHPVPGRRTGTSRPRTSPPEPGFDMRGLMTRVNRIRAARGAPAVPEREWPRTKADAKSYVAEVGEHPRRPLKGERMGRRTATLSNSA